MQLFRHWPSNNKAKSQFKNLKVLEFFYVESWFGWMARHGGFRADATHAGRE
jgi:hypothetical protein